MDRTGAFSELIICLKEGLDQAGEAWFARANLDIKSSGSFSFEDGISGAVLGLDCTSLS